jgi:hypothetical protein
VKCYCQKCGKYYSGTQRAGGHCTVCHWSFSSMSVGDAHSVKVESGGWRCLTPEEMTAKGWQVDATGTWRGKPRPVQEGWPQQR